MTNSRDSRRTPTAELQRLAIAGRDMPVQTRGQRKRAAPPSSPTTTRTSATPGSDVSRSQLARAAHRPKRASYGLGPGRSAISSGRGKSGVGGAGGAGGDDDEDDDDDDGDGDSDSSGESSGPDEGPAPNPIVEIMSIFAPGTVLLSELQRGIFLDEEQEPARQYSLVLNAMAAGARQSAQMLTELQAAVPVPGAFWVRQISTRLRLRGQFIFAQLESYGQRAIQGFNVTRAGNHLAALDVEVAWIIRRYFPRMQNDASRREILDVLLQLLATTIQFNREIGAESGQARPTYAGNTPRQDNLFANLIKDPPPNRPSLFVVGNLMRISPSVRSVRAQWLRNYCQATEQADAPAVFTNAFRRIIQALP